MVIMVLPADASLTRIPYYKQRYFCLSAANVTYLCMDLVFFDFFLSSHAGRSVIESKYSVLTL